jgi:hypothetical protein
MPEMPEINQTERLDSRREQTDEQTDEQLEDSIENPPGGYPYEERVIHAPVARYYAFLLGAALTLLGILGFIPFLTSDYTLLGVLRVTAGYNVIHLLSGLAGLAVGIVDGERLTRAYALLAGILYLVIFSMGNINFGNLSGPRTLAGDIPWILANALHAGIMLASWLVAGLASLQLGDRATRRYRNEHPWVYHSRTRLPAS